MLNLTAAILNSTLVLDHKLWTRFEYKSSLIISSQNRASYFTSKDERFPCVKYVTSDAALNARGDDKNLGRLEEPNFLNELPAASNDHRS